MKSNERDKEKKSRYRDVDIYTMLEENREEEEEGEKTETKLTSLPIKDPLPLHGINNDKCSLSNEKKRFFLHFWMIDEERGEEKFELVNFFASDDRAPHMHH